MILVYIIFVYIFRDRAKNALNGLLALLTYGVNRLTKYVGKFYTKRAMYNRYLASDNELNYDLKDLTKKVNSNEEYRLQNNKSMYVIREAFKLRNKYKQEYGIYPNRIIIDHNTLMMLKENMENTMLTKNDLITPEDIMGMKIYLEDSPYNDGIVVTFIDKSKMDELEK